MQIQLKNELMHAICAFEAKRSNWPNLGRKRKLTTADILDRIVFVCRTGCQWSQLPVNGASYKTVYHYFAMWSKARIFEDVFYSCASRASRNNEAPPWSSIQATSKTFTVLTYSAEIRPIVAVKLPRSRCSQILEVPPSALSCTELTRATF